MKLTKESIEYYLHRIVDDLQENIKGHPQTDDIDRIMTELLSLKINLAEDTGQVIGEKLVGAFCCLYSAYLFQIDRVMIAYNGGMLRESESELRKQLMSEALVWQHAVDGFRFSILDPLELTFNHDGGCSSFEAGKLYILPGSSAFTAFYFDAALRVRLTDMRHPAHKLKVDQLSWPEISKFYMASATAESERLSEQEYFSAACDRLGSVYNELVACIFWQEEQGPKARFGTGMFKEQGRLLSQLSSPTEVQSLYDLKMARWILQDLQEKLGGLIAQKGFPERELEFATRFQSDLREGQSQRPAAESGTEMLARAIDFIVWLELRTCAAEMGRSEGVSVEVSWNVVNSSLLNEVLRSVHMEAKERMSRDDCHGSAPATELFKTKLISELPETERTQAMDLPVTSEKPA